jgi:prevent-host-death family protein
LDNLEQIQAWPKGIMIHESTRTRTARKRSPMRRRKALPRELNVGEAKAVFSQLVDEAARGARFVIAKAGAPVARIVPLDVASEKFVFGTLKGLLSPADEQTLLDAVEAPLPDHIPAGFHASPLEAPE